jgi:hypothetical protein
VVQRDEQAKKRSKLSRWRSIAFMRPVLYTEIVSIGLAIGGWFAASALTELSATSRVLLWAVPLSVFFPFFAASSLYATYWVYLRRTGRAAAPAERHQGRKPAPASIRYVGWEAVEGPRTATESRSAHTASGPWFLRAKFAVDVAPSGSRSALQHVLAKVEFYDAAREKLIFSMMGRWASSWANDPETISGGRANAPGSMQCSLNVVLKYDEDDSCYGLDNETTVHAQDDWRYRQREIGQGEYSVKIVLRGDSIDETFRFRLVNRGQGYKARITQLPPQ